MTRPTPFRPDRPQAARQPKDVAFADTVREVTILRDGDRRIIVPADRSWDDIFAAPGLDLPDRSQPEADAREAF